MKVRFPSRWPGPWWQLLALLLVPPAFHLAAALDDRTRVALEALSRLKDADLNANPALKQAVLRVLEQVRGEPEFVQVVRDFKLTGQEPALAEFVLAQPASPAAVDALRLLLAQPPVNASNTIAPLLTGPPERTAAVVAALGHTDDRQIVPLLLPRVTDTNQSLAVRRTAVTALARVNEGATGLLALAKADTLPADLRFAAGAELRASRWPAVRAEAETLFPAPAAKGSGALPPVAELLQLPADPARGAAVFRRADVACIGCHQVNGEGVDFGPKLSEIGTKLGKDALIESILDPSAGISFGYEAWRIELKNGDELFGLLASETEDELAVNQQGGQVTRVKKAEVKAREKQALSVMPAGLQQNLTTQEFVDLIAYLAGLKKAGP